MAEALFYESSFGSVRLFLSRLSTDRSRTQVVHELSRGNEHVVQDCGQGPVRARGTVRFLYMPADKLSPVERCRALQAEIDDKPRVFRHPISGSYLARIGPFTEDIDGDGIITAEVEIVRVAPIDSLVSPGAGAIAAAGEGAVTSAADALAAELAELGIESSLPAAAKATVDGWNAAETVNTREVLTQVGSMTAQLGDLSETLEDDIEFWEAYKATILLSAQISAAAESVTSAETALTFVVHIGSPRALRAVLASVYPAEEADERYDQVLALNDITSPAWLDAGTQLVLPQPPAQSRTA